MSKIIHNLLNTAKTYGGLQVAANSSYSIPEEELAGFQNDSKVYAALVADPAQVAIEDSENPGQITGIAGIELLKKTIIVTTPNDSLLTPEAKIQKVAVYKAEGSSTTKVSHDWTDKCTWYTESTQITDETLTLVAGKNYSSTKQFWIDANHGRIYAEDSLTTTGVPLHFGGVRKYSVIVKDNGTTLTEDTDYTVNYEDGEVDLDAGYTAVGDIVATYYYAGGASFVMAPLVDKKMVIEHAELQFSKDIQMQGAINFEVWVWNPDQVNYPGQKMLYQKIVYKNMKDIINSANLGQGFIPAVGGLAQDVCVFPFNYATSKYFSYSTGAELRITLDGDLPMTGEWGTATFYILSENE